MKKIGIVTGTRAEYGLLKPVMREIQKDEEISLCIIATGMHLAEQYGYTYKEIENDGFTIDYKNDMQLGTDTESGICKSMGIELSGFADIFKAAKLDMLILLGDRYEIEVAAVAALVHHIPIAHIGGGEITEGAMDDAIRHSITKMSDLHFTSMKKYSDRVIQMGEQPDRVFTVGALGTENIKNLKLYDRKELCEKFGKQFEKPFVMVTYHPVTLESHTAKGQFEAILSVIKKHPEYQYIFTYANADPDGLVINKLIEEFVKKNDNTKAIVSMGQMGYLSALKYCEFVLGNSSSGLVEAPSFHIPTINVGDRQRGRVRSKTVIDCGYGEEEIEAAFSKAKDKDFLTACMHYPNPYEGLDAVKTIVKEIKKFLAEDTGKEKKFYDIKKKNIAIIPARSGSKGLKDKNIKKLCGKPLLAYAIEAAYASGKFDCVHVSTDSEEYAEIARNYGADVPFLRADFLSTDGADSWDTVRWVMERYMELGQEFDTVTLLQPTSPLRDANDIRNAFKIFEKNNADSVVSVCKTDHSPLQCNTLGESGSLNGFLDRKAVVRRQELADYYRINGAVYIQKTELLMAKGNLYGEKSYASIMSRDHSVDIDEELDFIIAEAIMSHKTAV